MRQWPITERFFAQLQAFEVLPNKYAAIFIPLFENCRGFLSGRSIGVSEITASTNRKSFSREIGFVPKWLEDRLPQNYNDRVRRVTA
jgi:hypothetical protein